MTHDDVVKNAAAYEEGQAELERTFVPEDHRIGEKIYHCGGTVPIGEIDPNGIDQHAPGAKLDDGKPFVDDILAGFPRALMCVCQVGTFGAKKYSLNGWKEVKDGIRRYRNAAGRHRLYRQQGEIYDKDSGFKHEWHEAWNVLAALELEQKFQEEHGCD